MAFIRLTKTINRITGELASWIIFAMMLLAVVDTVGRYAFKSSIFGAQDITQLMMVVVVFFGFGLVAEEDGNVRIEIMYQHFSPKLKAIMNVFAWVLGIAAYSIVSYKLLMRAFTVFEKQNASTMTLGISLAPFLLIAAIGCFLLLLQLISNIILNVMGLLGKNPQAEEGGKAV